MWCAACGHGIAADKGNSLVRHARTAHRAAAHYAWLTLKEGGKNSHRHGFAATPPSKREASYNHSRKEGSHASRPCVRASFLPTMAKNSFRDARTPHCGDAHNAWLTLKEGGKNSHRRGFAAPPPSKREARLYGVPAVNSVREEGYLPLRYPICAYLRFCGRVRQRAPKCCHLRAVERNRTQSQWRTLGFSSPHGISFCQFKKKFVNIFTPPSPATAA